MTEIRLGTVLRPQAVALGLQSAVAAFGGSLSRVTDTTMVVAVDPYARPDVLKQLYRSQEDLVTYRQAVKIQVQIVEGASTTVILSLAPSLWYMLDALRITESTFDSFARTASQTFEAIEGDRRPPDRPPPPR